MYNKRRLGNQMEKKAAAYLTDKGYEILSRNFVCYFGEIDIIAKDGKAVVFIEVKYRKDKSSGYPYEAVTRKKQETIKKCAKYYILKNKLPQEAPYRYDVVSITGGEITQMKNAFGNM